MQDITAVLRAIGSEHGYYNATDWKKCAKIDMIVETYANCFEECAKILYQTEFAARPAAMENLRDSLLTRFLHMCENELKNNVYS